MRRIKSEFGIIGSGAAAMLAANRLTLQGHDIVLINPMPEYGIGDLRPHHGLGLWNAAYRSDDDGISLADLQELLESRLREIFPAPLEQSGLSKGECWSVLSTTPVHRNTSQELEREFFRLERKKWSTGQFRLVNPETVVARAHARGINLPLVAQIEGAVLRSYAIGWDAPRMGLYLTQFIHHRFPERVFTDAEIEGHYGRKVVFQTREGEEVSFEAERGIFVFLTGDLLPSIKSIVASCDEPWIQGVRKRRREQHFIWFRGAKESAGEPFWMELGPARYRLGSRREATWSARKGPDDLDRVVDEALRLQKDGRFTGCLREFCLEWEWKGPAWRQTRHSLRWATAFEGDLFNMTELLWNLPLD